MNGAPKGAGRQRSPQLPSGTEPVHVLIVQPDPRRRRELVESIRRGPDLRVIGAGSHFLDACERNSRAQQVHVLLVQIHEPETTRIEWWALIHALLPGVAVVALARHFEPHALMVALGAGVIGLQPFNAQPSILCDAVRQAARGIPHYDQRMTEQLKRSLLATASEGLGQTVGASPLTVRAQPTDGTSPDWLTLREREVLRLVGEGLRNRDIGTRLHLSEKTVRNCVSAILGKLGLRSRTEAALWLNTRPVSPGNA